MSIKNVVEEKRVRCVVCEACGKSEPVTNGGFHQGKVCPVGHTFITVSIPLHGRDHAELPHPRAFKDFCSYKCLTKFAREESKKQ